MNIVELGIDVSSFTKEKEQTLARYIKLFNDLSEYDGKVYNPILGTGIVEFNKSAEETNVLLDKISKQITNISTTSQKSFSASTTATKAATTESKNYATQLQKTSDIQNKINQLLGIGAKAAEGYAQEQARVVDILRDKAIEDDKAEKQAKKDIAKKEAQDARDLAAAKRQQTKDQNDATAAADRAQKQAEKDRTKKEAQDARDLARAKREEARARAEAAKEQKEANKQADEESKINRSLLNELEQLKKIRKDQAEKYANAYVNGGGNGKDDASKQALADYAATNGIIDNIEEKLGRAGNSSKLLGDAFAHLRNIAYILPGLGIAGIFNLAFEAIGNAVSALFDFNSELSKELSNETEITKNYREQLNVLRDILEQKEKLFQLAVSKSSSNQGIEAERLSARGYDRGITLQADVAATGAGYAEIVGKIEKKTGKLGIKAIEATVDNIGDLIKKQEGLAQEIKETDKFLEEELPVTGKDNDEKFYKLKDKIKAREDFAKKFGLNVTKFGTYSGDEARIFLENRKQKLNADKEDNEELLKNLDTYIKSKAALQRAAAEQEKFNEDEARKRKYEFAKEEVALNLDKNERVLRQEIKSQEDKETALRNVYNQQLKLNAAERTNITSNKSSTPVEKEVAEKKKVNDDILAERKLTTDLFNLDEDYRQRRIAATTAINKDQVEKVAIANEKVYKNEAETLEERLQAYATYIGKKQVLQDLEYSKDIEKLSLKADDPTARLERSALNSTRELQKANIQADVEKQVYDITYTSLQKQLKSTIQFNSLEEEANNKAYTKELIDLNNRFNNNLVSYRGYAKERRKIDEQYTIKNLDQQVIDDKKRIGKIQDQIDKERAAKGLSDVGVAKAKSEATIPGTPDENNARKSNLDTQVGLNKAQNDAIIQAELELKKAQQELDKDELARAKLKYDTLAQYQKEYYNNYLSIINALANLVKTYVDAEYEAEIENVENIIKAKDEQFDHEQDAVEKSSLTAKDKHALEVKLAAEKEAADKNAQKEQKKLRRDQAIFDREIAIAKILFNTQESVSLALATIPPPFGEGIAIQRGILGGIEIATVLATKLPSFAEGVIDFEGGMARYGEAGTEMVVEPYKSPYLVHKETIGYLPKGTDVIPMKEANFTHNQVDSSWEQTRFLAKEIRKGRGDVKRVVNNININLGFETYKQSILGYG